MVRVQVDARRLTSRQGNRSGLLAGGEMGKKGAIPDPVATFVCETCFASPPIRQRTFVSVLPVLFHFYSP